MCALLLICCSLIDSMTVQDLSTLAKSQLWTVHTGICGDVWLFAVTEACLTYGPRNQASCPAPCNITVTQWYAVSHAAGSNRPSQQSGRKPRVTIPAVYVLDFAPPALEAAGQVRNHLQHGVGVQHEALQAAVVVQQGDHAGLQHQGGAARGAGLAGDHPQLCSPRPATIPISCRRPGGKHERWSALEMEPPFPRHARHPDHELDTQQCSDR